MDIRSHLSLVGQEPSAYHTLGLGVRSWAVVHPLHRDEVLLLERPLIHPNGKDAPPASTRRAHERAVQFARKYDRFLIAGLRREDGGRYAHSSLIEALPPQALPQPVALSLGEDGVFMVHSARLVRRIQGVSLHPMHFADPQAPLHNRNKVDSLARDIATWLFKLHYKVTPEVMRRYRVEEQFASVGASITNRFEKYDKYDLFVKKNMRELRSQVSGDSLLRPDAQKRLKGNLARTGIDFSLMAQAAEVIGAQLGKIMPLDRVGLAHTDLHPGNIITDSTYTNVNGVCDWANGTIAPLSVDFAGLAMARGLLPRVMSHYSALEKDGGSGQPVHKEAVFGFAAMRLIYFSLRNMKTGHDVAKVPFFWEQVGESVQALQKINPAHYGALAGKFAAQNLPKPKVPAVYGQVASQPAPPSLDYSS